jgi:hypothetical protein
LFNIHQIQAQLHTLMRDSDTAVIVNMDYFSIYFYCFHIQILLHDKAALESGRLGNRTRKVLPLLRKHSAFDLTNRQCDILPGQTSSSRGRNGQRLLLNSTAKFSRFENDFILSRSTPVPPALNS